MRRLLPRLAFVLLLLACSVAPARETELGPGAAPEKNFSHIHADVSWVVKAFQAAEGAAAEGDWATAVRTLQGIIDQRLSRESPADAAVGRDRVELVLDLPGPGLQLVLLTTEPPVLPEAVIAVSP